MHNNHLATSSITINATPTQVWEALTTPSIVKQYLFGTDMETTWEVGSPITYSGEWEGKAYTDKGTVLEFVPEQKIVTTYWSAASGPETLENISSVTYTVEPTEEGTTLTVIQDNNKDEASATHSENNWNMVLQKMKEVLEH